MQNSKEELLEKIAKIKALAERGVGGEKEVAQKLLQRLMEENSITDEDISSEVVKAHEFWYEKNIPFTTKLLAQIVYSVLGDIDDNKGMREYLHKTKGRVAILCTDAEYLEIVAKYEFYVYHLAEDMRLLYKAFIQTNNLYPPDGLTKPSTSCNPATKEDKQAAMLSMVLEKHEYRKQIEGGRKDV